MQRLLEHYSVHLMKVLACNSLPSSKILKILKYYKSTIPVCIYYSDTNLNNPILKSLLPEIANSNSFSFICILHFVYSYMGPFGLFYFTKIKVCCHLSTLSVQLILWQSFKKNSAFRSKKFRERENSKSNNYFTSTTGKGETFSTQ